MVALANARPEAPGGYHYQQPSLPVFPVQTQQIPQRIPISNSYGAPITGNGIGLSSGSHFIQSSDIGSSNGFGSNGGFASGSHGFSSSASNGFSSGISNGGFSGGFAGGASISQSSGGFATGNSLNSGGFSSGGGLSSNIGFGGSIGSSSSSFGTGISQVQQAPIVQKHIYVHVPPPEPIEEQQRILSAAAPRTNYKIIFIKAPTAPAVSPAIIQQQQQSQEKTIVYVLVKKPDEQESLVLSGLAPTKPSKPEVYFIKYQARKEAGGGGGSLNLGASDVSGHVDAGIGLDNGGGISLGNGGGISLGNGGGISLGHGGGVALGNGGGIQLNTGSSSSLSSEYGVPRSGGYN